MFRHSTKKTKVSVSVVASDARHAVSGYLQVMKETGLNWFLSNLDSLHHVKLNSAPWVALLNDFSEAREHYNALLDLWPRLDVVADDLILTIDTFYVEAINIRSLVEKIWLCQDMMDERINVLHSFLKRSIALINLNFYPEGYSVVTAFDFIASRTLFLMLAAVAFSAFLLLTSLLSSKQESAASDHDFLFQTTSYSLALLTLKFAMNVVVRLALSAMHGQLVSEREALFDRLNIALMESLDEYRSPRFHPISVSNVNSLFSRRGQLAIEPAKESRESVLHWHSRSPVRPRH